MIHSPFTCAFKEPGHSSILWKYLSQVFTIHRPARHQLGVSIACYYTVNWLPPPQRKLLTKPNPCLQSDFSLTGLVFLIHQDLKRDCWKTVCLIAPTLHHYQSREVTGVLLQFSNSSSNCLRGWSLQTIMTCTWTGLLFGTISATRDYVKSLLNFNTSETTKKFSEYTP